MGYHNVVSHVLAIAIPIVCTFAVLLVLRLVAKLKWLTAVCLSIIADTLPLFFAFEHFPYMGRMPDWALQLLLLLPPTVCAVILFIQFFYWAASGESRAVNAVEREKILRMVEDGKISADEGSELLDAMGRSNALRAQEKFSRLDMAMLVGAALVVLGFFLPWVYIRMPRVPVIPTPSFGAQVPTPRPLMPRFLGNASLYQTGPNIGAIGWIIFIIGILAAMPVFVTPKDFLYKISMLQIFLILIGLVLVISILVRAGHNLGAGLVICLAGFVTELCASAAKFKNLSA